MLVFSLKGVCRLAIKPPQLRPGDTIGIVTLGSPLEASVINESIRTLESLGFSVIVGDTVYLTNGFLGDRSMH